MGARVGLVGFLTPIASRFSVPRLPVRSSGLGQQQLRVCSCCFAPDRCSPLPPQTHGLVLILFASVIGLALLSAWAALLGLVTVTLTHLYVTAIISYLWPDGTEL